MRTTRKLPELHKTSPIRKILDWQATLFRTYPYTLGSLLPTLLTKRRPAGPPTYEDWCVFCGEIVLAFGLFFFPHYASFYPTEWIYNTLFFLGFLLLAKIIQFLSWLAEWAKTLPLFFRSLFCLTYVIPSLPAYDLLWRYLKAIAGAAFFLKSLEFADFCSVVYWCVMLFLGLHLLTKEQKIRLRRFFTIRRIIISTAATLTATFTFFALLLSVLQALLTLFGRK